MSCFTLSIRPVMLFIAFTGLAVLTASCGPAERLRERAAVEPSPSPTAAEREISGVFNVEGSAENGNNPYTGVLTIQPQGDAYGFRWTTTKGTRVGTGVQIGNATATSFAATGGGKGCTVFLYKISSDGSLDGKFVDWGYQIVGTEKAKRIEGRTFVGKYEVAGDYGHPYKGTLTIKKDGSGYDFDWNLEDAESGPFNRVAFGTWKGSFAAASSRGRQCSFAVYDIQSNGNLNGDWGGQAAVTFGTETAKRQ
ncbi:MAG: hypothetical protein QM785_13505 [Pyrinomonadaceae bacterium]